MTIKPQQILLHYCVALPSLSSTPLTLRFNDQQRRQKVPLVTLLSCELASMLFEWIIE